MSVLVSSGGCLLPLLIAANLFFGHLFLKTSHWLALEGILIAIFWLNSYLFTRRLFSKAQKRDNVIDVEGEVLKDHKRIP